jgi:DNA-binding protein HU-beta
MNKSDLIGRVAEVSDLSHAKAEIAVNSMLDAIGEALNSGQKVTLVGFGTFKTYERSARKGRNPKTGESIDIASKRVVKFKAGTRLNEALR